MYRNALLWAHIVGVAAWLGTNLATFVLEPWFHRRSAEVAAAFADATSFLARRFYNAAGVVVGVTGVLLVENAGYGWGSGFIVVGLVALVVGAGFGVVVFAPTGARLGAATRQGDTSTVSALRRRTIEFLSIDTAVVMLTVLAMVARWRAR